MNTKLNVMRDLLLFITGIAVILFAFTKTIHEITFLSKTLETIGIAMVGYGPIQLIVNLINYTKDSTSRRKLENMFSSIVRVVENKETLPIFIAVDIEGCITPSNRSQIDLSKLQRLKAYCEFTKEHTEYPPLILYTGRSQGYVELLSQTLGILDFRNDLPFVIENGAALYRPGLKQTIPLFTQAQIKIIREVEAIIMEELPNNNFEPKSYMITINPNIHQNVDDLREFATLLLSKKGLVDSLNITNTASAVDITPIGISKLAGLYKVLNYLPSEKSTYQLDEAVSIGDHIADLPILAATGSSYCPAQNVHTEVRDYIEDRFGSTHVIDKPNIEFVISVIEQECGLSIA